MDNVVHLGAKRSGAGPGSPAPGEVRQDHSQQGGAQTDAEGLSVEIPALSRGEVSGSPADWKSGVWVRQYLQTRRDLAATAEQWRVIFTNPPPTSITTNFLDRGATNSPRHYRIRAAR